MKSICLLICYLVITLSLSAQVTNSNFIIDIGIRCKKFTGFYWENGITGEFSSAHILQHKIQFGFNLLSSRLGSALNSNAVPTLEAELSVIKHFRHSKAFQPLVRLNFGFAHANYMYDVFNDLPTNGALLSFETGVSYLVPIKKENFKLCTSGGYNFLTGNGKSGLATVYPIYGQFSVMYRID